MPSINKSAIVPYTQQEMYQLVNDIESYSQFIPYCQSSQIISHHRDELRATLSFARGGFHKSFTTVNRMQPYKMIEIRLIQGPFKQLEGFWRFEIKDNGCKVSLDLEFEFASRLLDVMFGPLFNQVAMTLVDAFTERAEVVYGAKP